jgi:hypothetical protein
MFQRYIKIFAPYHQVRHLCIIGTLSAQELSQILHELRYHRFFIDEDVTTLGRGDAVVPVVILSPNDPSRELVNSARSYTLGLHTRVFFYTGSATVRIVRPFDLSFSLYKYTVCYNVLE